VFGAEKGIYISVKFGSVYILAAYGPNELTANELLELF
jgi:hypothetical protein